MKKMKDSIETFENNITAQVSTNKDHIAGIKEAEKPVENDKPNKKQCEYTCKDAVGGGRTCLVDQCFDTKSNDVSCEEKICKENSGNKKLIFFVKFTFFILVS